MRNLERGALLGCGGVLVRDFFRPARRVGGGSGTKFSLLAKNGLKSAFWGVLGEFYTGWAAEPGVLGELFRGSAREVGCWARFFAEFRQEEVCWESFLPVSPAEAASGDSFVPEAALHAG